jgi:hypothetical protein
MVTVTDTPPVKLWKQYIKVKVKLSRYRPSTGPWGPRRLRLLEFLDNQHRKVVRLSVLCTGRLYPQEGFLVLIYVRGWVDPRAIMRPAGLNHWKIPVTPSGIEPATFRFVVQCLNQLRHRVPLEAVYTKPKIEINSESLKVFKTQWSSISLKQVMEVVDRHTFWDTLYTFLVAITSSCY